MTCPTLKYEIRKGKFGASIRARRESDGKAVGQIHLESVRDNPELLKVAFVQIEKPLRRCGIGTRLYEAALRIACERGQRLASDTHRTKGSEAFWEKQKKRGRAQCVTPGLARKLTESFEPTRGSWGCKRYAMRTACPTAFDLSGRKKRKKPKKGR